MRAKRRSSISSYTRSIRNGLFITFETYVALDSANEHPDLVDDIYVCHLSFVAREPVLEKLLALLPRIETSVKAVDGTTPRAGIDGVLEPVMSTIVVIESEEGTSS